MSKKVKEELLAAKDLELLSSMGIAKTQVLNQLEMFEKGVIPPRLVKAATTDDCITRFSRSEQEELISLFSKESNSYKIIKFVPASGAATRMFKTLFNFNLKLDEINEQEVRKRAAIGEKGYDSLLSVIEGLTCKKFAFYMDLKAVLAIDGISMVHLMEEGQFKTIIDYLLTEKGLNYANIPKALIKFHQYDDYSRTSIEEHLVEGMVYSKDKNNIVHIHFTVSPKFKQMVKQYIDSIIHLYRKNGITFNIEFSEQKLSTNTLATDENNNFLRDMDNNLVLRPGGHGALIENLNDLDGDIIFIKNIDNVVPEPLKEVTIRYKKIMGGYLMKLQIEIFSFLKILSKGKKTGQELDKITLYSRKFLNISFPGDFNHRSIEERKKLLIKKLNRPLRVCGMVKNEGEPGGGPFIVEGPDKTLSLQIVEGAQVNKDSEEQQQILKNSTHFNPVDLVCSVRDFQGNKFNLLTYIDSDSYFISSKPWKERSLKALELPGLWNGAMAGWITVFVEVPITTFNPIKTVNDLLRKEHQQSRL